MRERQREARAMETDDEREVRLERQRHSQRETRAMETDDEREVRLERQRHRQRETRAMETDDEREVKLERHRHRRRETRAMETDHEREVRLERQRHRQRELRFMETARQRDERLQSLRVRQRDRISTETDEHRNDRLQIMQENQRDMETGNERQEERASSSHHFLKFHTHLNSLEINKCSTCLEAFPGLRLCSTECYRCYRDHQNPKLYSQLNNMDPGPVPPQLQMYSDYGFHTSRVKLQRNSSGQLVRVVSGKPSEKFINALGYPNIFPMLLRLLPPDSSKLGYVLKQVYNKSLLWSDFGLRSLVKDNIFYRKPNFPGEEYVWRGPIHIHMNYLALRALHYYSNMAGPYAGIAKKIYTQLRTNVIETVTIEYFKTGSLWTYYDDVTGNGKGTSENSKMSSLIILIMAEKYY